MFKKSFLILFVAGCATATAFAATKASSVTRHDITWTFDKEYEVGQFVNGDWYVVGPAKIINIDNSLSDKSFMEGLEYDVHGAMINPQVGLPWQAQPGESPIPHNDRVCAQGYDERFQHYKPELNAALPNDKPLSKDNPLEFKPDQSLVSMVSWLWRSPTEKEEGCPQPPTEAPPRGYARPSMRSGAVLTCLAEAPPEGTFRPPYAGDVKKLHNLKDIKRDRLRNLDPVESIEATPLAAPIPDEQAIYRSYNNRPSEKANIPLLIQATTRAWIQHIPGWFGGTVFAPSSNLCNYARENCHVLQSGMLALNLDWSKIEDVPKSKDPLIINLVQIGIDTAACAETGSHWTSHGGNGGGRKPIIVFAGLLLDDEKMKTISRLDDQFQEGTATFYLKQEHIDQTNSEHWQPDLRATHVTPYSQDMLGMPEWGGNNCGWHVAYRETPIGYMTGFALTFLMMEDGRKTFNNEAYFDYIDRANGRMRDETEGYGMYGFPFSMAFPREMWDTYRKDYPSTYDSKKWDTDAIVERCTTPGFVLKPINNKGQLVKEFNVDTEPVRITVGYDVDLSGLTPQTVQVTAGGDTIPVQGIEYSDKLGDQFVIRFADGVLKKGTTYTVALDSTVSGKWRNTLDLPLLSNKVSFGVR